MFTTYIIDEVEWLENIDYAITVTPTGNRIDERENIKMKPVARITIRMNKNKIKEL